MVLRRFLALCLLSPLLAASGGSDEMPGVAVNEPLQVTFEADSVGSAGVSPDGGRLVYVSTRKGDPDLWIGSADPAHPLLPRQLTSDPALEQTPSFSRDGRRITYVGTGYDVKGDIYLMDLGTGGTGPIQPRRLTGRETGDQAPCFSPDGRTLYFHRYGAGTSVPALARLDLTDPTARPATLDTGGDASFPRVSPDGKTLVFVSFREDPAGDLYLLDLVGGRVTALTRGPARDRMPAWSQDGSSVFFARVHLDTNRDGRISDEDRPVLWRIDSGGNGEAHPVTSAAESALGPMTGGNRLFFLSGRGGTVNVWSLPLQGEIPLEKTPEEQMGLAARFAAGMPPDRHLAILGYHKVLEICGTRLPVAGKAAYAIGEQYLRMDMPEAAAEAFERVTTDYPEARPEAGLASVRLAQLQTRRDLATETVPTARQERLARGLQTLRTLAAAHPDTPRIQARAEIEQARLLSDFGEGSAALLDALDRLRTVIEQGDGGRAQVAEAMLLCADLYSRVGRSQEVLPGYFLVIDTCGDLPEWVGRAVQRILELALATDEAADLTRRVQLLRGIAEENRGSRPDLAMGAWNRIGDLYHAGGEWDKAKAQYRQVIRWAEAEGRPGHGHMQLAAARLALAEILYREQRFREALALYETEIGTRSRVDPVYELARQGYIRKSIASGEYLYRLGEVPAARKVFAELLRYDDAIIEAHRGYVKCAAATGDLAPVLEGYRNRMLAKPEDPVALYATGLCLTYREDRASMIEARALIGNAVALQGRVAYFHQTLGYVHEVLETVYGEKGQLELAAEDYQKAAFLNDPERNPENEAHLLLNLGNSHFLLEQYASAYRFYSERMETDVPFDNSETEILFWRRFGIAAFQIRERDRPVEAFQRALALIEERVQPRQASEAFERMNRYVKDTILAPAGRKADTASRANALAREHADIHRRLFEVTRAVSGPPPNPAWEQYRQGIGSLLTEQKGVNRKALRLAADLGGDVDEVRQTLALMVDRVSKALQAPTRYLELTVEMLDRLGLARQDAGQWQEATEAFERAYELNTRLGLTRNLAANRRSVAYNRYQQAGTVSGPEREELLRKAAQDFQEVIRLVKHHGVAAQEGRAKRSKGGGVRVDLDVSLDASSATQAAYGFSSDQEIRLAEAFLARIGIEQGELLPAHRALQNQKADIPREGKIPEKDLFGISLLYHRSALVAASLGRATEAFDDFSRSARLCHTLGNNPVSASVNVTNMARLLVTMDPASAETRNREQTFRLLERETSRLFKEKGEVLDPAIPAGYHNTLGVHAFQRHRVFGLRTASSSPGQKGREEMEASVQSLECLQQAGMHFAQGIAWLEENTGSGGGPRSRKRLELEAALHLNQAELARALGETGDRARHLEIALDLSEKARYPAIRWRSLAGLGRVEEALQVLERMTLLEVGCGPMEILQTFAPLVREKVREGETEEAFNLAEALSEQERVHRLVPLVLGDLPDRERQLYRSLYPRVLEIHGLRQRLARASGDEKHYLQKRLDQEEALLADGIGPNREHLPSLAALAETPAAQEMLVVLVGLALHAEEVADRLASAGQGGQRDVRLEAEHDALIEQYRQVASRAFTERQTSGVLTLVLPAPAELIDIMENLPEEGLLVRLFPAAGEEGPEDGEDLFAFVVTPDDFSVKAVSRESFQVGSFVQEYFEGAADTLQPVLAFDAPGSLSRQVGHSPRRGSVALSGTHFLRSFENRKPFKRRLLSVAGPEAMDGGYEVEHLAGDTTVSEILQSLPSAHGLLLGGRIGTTLPVPTRPGQRPAPGLTMELDNGRRFPLSLLAGRLPSLSLTVTPEGTVEEAYELGHLLSLFGCPSLLLAPRQESNPGLVASFFRAYAETSAADALREADPDAAAGQRWMLLGYPGMEEADARNFARTRFASYVQQAGRDFQAGRYLQALVRFEAGLDIARESGAHRQYLPELYRTCRESAFAAGRYEQAERYARARVDTVAETAPDSEAHAEALLRLGLIQARQEKFDLAVASLEEAREMMEALELGPEEVEALSDLGVVLENATEYDQALLRLRAAVRLGESLGKDELVARQHEHIGRIEDLRLSDYLRGRQSYEKALAIYRDMENREGVVQALTDIGRCDRLLGNFEAAQAHYEEAMAGVGDDPALGRLKVRLLLEQANNAWFQGRYQEAFGLRGEADRLARENGWVLERVIGLNTSGLIWWTLGEPERALRELEDALALARTLPGRQDEVATTFNNLGLVYRELGRFDDAMERFDQALAIDRKLRSRWAIAYDLRNKGLTYLHVEQPGEALPLLEEAAREASAIGNRINEAKALTALGNAYAAEGRVAEARASFEQALEASRVMSMPETQWRCLHGLAGLHLAQGELLEAKTLLFQAVQVIEGMRAAIHIDHLKDGFLDNKLAVYERLVTLLADLGETEEAFDVAERGRARNFIDLLGNQRLHLRGALDQELYEREARLKARVREQEALVAQAATPGEQQAYTRALDRARDDYRDLMIQIQTERPDLAALVTVDPLGAGDLRGMLSPDVALAAYFVTPEEVLCWVVRHQGMRLIRTPLPRETLERDLLDYRRAIQNLEPVETLSRRLYGWLIAPVLPELGDVRVLGIVPHGVLHYLSFATLSDADSYLIDRFPLFYLPSASVFRYTLERRSSGKNLKVLAIGNPDLENPAMDLPFAEQEVGSIKWNFPEVTLLTRERATESWVGAHIGAFGIIHFASHGEFDPVNPLFSALKLAGDRQADGNLEASEIFGLDIQADLVVLSACQTGLAEVTRGDDLIGFNRAFFYAGTHAIVSSLWRVSDISTAILIKAFYREYQDREKAESLRQAMLHVKNRTPHPGYWGAFCLVGDYQ